MDIFITKVRQKVCKAFNLDDKNIDATDNLYNLVASDDVKINKAIDLTEQEFGIKFTPEQRLQLSSGSIQNLIDATIEANQLK